MTRSPDTEMPRRVLSAEAADELVRYLYLLIDEIQFRRYREELSSDAGESTASGQQSTPPGFDDPIPF